MPPASHENFILKSENSKKKIKMNDFEDVDKLV
jgi:hypothetical protein